MSDYAIVFLGGTGKEPWNIHERHQGYPKGVTEADEAGALYRSVNVQDSGGDEWLVRHYAHWHTS